MPARKRGRQEAELDLGVVKPEELEHNETLYRLRNMWEFASLMQYIFIFGRVVKIDDDLDIEDLETECLRAEPSEKLAQIGLAFLKYVSSHRGLTSQIFDEYTRRQYEAKAPARNPFGVEEEPKSFDNFDPFTKIRVLHQLSIWTLGNAERIRAVMPEEREVDQTQWRIEAFGWDSDERTYFLLDDDRLYRRTDAPLPAAPQPKPKAKAKPKKSRGTRASKRRKLSTPGSEAEEDNEQDEAEAEAADATEIKDEQAPEDDRFGGMKWECIAITLEEYQELLETFRKSRDPNEKALCKAITADVLPILEKKAEAQRQKALKRHREWETLQKLATAKRSSRLAGKIERQKQEEEDAAAEKKRIADIDMAHKEQERQQKMEQARESRMLTREQRLKERDVKRILHEEELAKLEALRSAENADARVSERQLKSEMERRQRELEQLAEEEDKWVFDCSVCGMHGENLDDGTHSIACENCNIWQHSKCHGIKVADAERDDFHFVCKDCKRKEDDAKKPKIAPLKLGRIGGHGTSPQAASSDGQPPVNGMTNGASSTPQPQAGAQNGFAGVFIPPYNPTPSPGPRPSSQAGLMNGPSLSPHGQSHGPPGYRPAEASPVGVPQPVWHGTSLPPPQRPAPSGIASSPPPPAPPTMNGHAQSPYNLHHEAHAGAVASSNMPAYGYAPHTNGRSNGSMPPPSPHDRPTHSNGMSQGQRPQSGQTANGIHSSPTKSRAPMSSPQPYPHMGQSSPRGPLMAPYQSPNASFAPSAQHYYQQQAAAHSPVKQSSSSPQHYQQQPHHQSYSPLSIHPAATPTNNPHAHAHAAAATPMSGVLHASPHMASSPIPPLGPGPVIPTKHDTPRPPASQSFAGGSATPLLGPAVVLSPIANDSGKGMGVESGEGGLGIGNVPVKRMPEQAQEELGDAVMRDV